jgi:hypothetical protein
MFPPERTVTYGLEGSPAEKARAEVGGAEADEPDFDADDDDDDDAKAPAPAMASSGGSPFGGGVEIVTSDEPADPTGPKKGPGSKKKKKKK